MLELGGMTSLEEYVTQDERLKIGLRSGMLDLMALRKRRLNKAVHQTALIDIATAVISVP